MKLIDFNTAKGGLKNVKGNHFSHDLITLTGSPMYRAPEVVKGLKHSESVDLWGIGMVILYILTGENPFFD
jgi:serine/threonine protein kinase